MKSTGLHLKALQRPGRVLRGMYLILLTRDTYGYNSVWERIYRFLVKVPPGPKHAGSSRRRMLYDRT